MARILVVDDEPSIVKLVSATLRARGHTTFEAHDGVEAIEQAKALKPDLILLDIMMPRMTGTEARKRLHEDPSTAKIPVIHLSAVGDFERQLESMEDGLTDYITKPFVPKDLANHVEDFLDPAKREQAQRLAHQKTGKLRTIVEIMHRERND
jgi:two-component system, OmpR family, alkaline phosphatase synthesis response regulator PhoP